MIIFLCLQHASSQTAGIIVGRVFDAATGDCLPDSFILVPGTHYMASTDNCGRYILSNLQAGVYNLVVCAGLQPFDQDTIWSVRVFPGKTDTLDIKLYPYGSRQALEDIGKNNLVLSPSRELLSQIPSNVRETITRKYGFRPGFLGWDWCGTGIVPGNVYDFVIAEYLDARNGKGWQARLRNELEMWIAQHKEQTSK